MDFCEGRQGHMMYDFATIFMLLILNSINMLFVFFVGNRRQNRMIGHNLRRIRFAYRAIVLVCREKSYG
jgi:hypothetical protein